jgi:hypothetical protein
MEGVVPIDMKVFIKNRSEVPPESLVKYGGQWVAWSPDGTHIVAASSQSDAAVYRLLEEAGLDFSEHVIGYVPGPEDEGFIGLLPEAAFNDEDDAPLGE